MVRLGLDTLRLSASKKVRLNWILLKLCLEIFPKLANQLCHFPDAMHMIFAAIQYLVLPSISLAVSTVSLHSTLPR